ncbi:MAG: hypothetical protein JO316_25535 [Abitibacteriaceae bacterium]|nr:hypothetical protein [Abditibacteriaceae bacterium]MBV9868734.1 hypothetical protein [Abditibacteriaceae bacterium]
MKHTFKIGAGVALVVIVGGFSVLHLWQSPNAQQILGHMAKVYTECKSYRDTGVVKSANGTFSMEGTFATAFVRPDRFRFDYTGKNSIRPEFRYIVCQKGQVISRWSDVSPHRPPPESLGLALAGGTGVSGGAAHTIPALLLPDQVKGWQLTDMTAATRIGDESLNGIPCFRIRGKNVLQNRSLYLNSTLLLWVDKKTYVLRKLEETSEIHMGTTIFKTVTTTTYDVNIDTKINDDEFEFNPPQA